MTDRPFPRSVWHALSVVNRWVRKRDITIPEEQRRRLFHDTELLLHTYEIASTTVTTERENRRWALYRVMTTFRPDRPTYEEVAQRFDISRERVRQLYFAMVKEHRRLQRTETEQWLTREGLPASYAKLLDDFDKQMADVKRQDPRWEMVHPKTTREQDRLPFAGHHIAMATNTIYDAWVAAGRPQA